MISFNFNFRNLFDNKSWYNTHGYIRDINCRLQDVRPFVFKRGWYWEGLPCVLVLRSDERTFRCHLVLAVHSSGDHAAPRPIRTEQPCTGEVPARSKLILLPEATIRDEYCHWLPSVHLQDGLGSAQDFVHEGQHDVHPDYCGIGRSPNGVWRSTSPIWIVVCLLFQLSAIFKFTCFRNIADNSSDHTTKHQNVMKKFSKLVTSKVSVFGLPIWCLMREVGMPALAWRIYFPVASVTKEVFTNLAELPLNFSFGLAEVLLVRETTAVVIFFVSLTVVYLKASDEGRPGSQKPLSCSDNWSCTNHKHLVDNHTLRPEQNGWYFAQLGALITLANISWYCTHHCNDISKVQISLGTHKRHPIPGPHGQAMGCLLEGFCRKLYYNSTTLFLDANFTEVSCLESCW